MKKITPKVLQRGIDSIAWLASADMLEEQGDDAGAFLWRKRAGWLERFLVAIKESELLPGQTNVTWCDRPGSGWSILTKRTAKITTVRFLLRGYRSPISGWLSNDILDGKKRNGYIRKRLLEFVEQAIRNEKADRGAKKGEMTPDAVAEWLATEGYYVARGMCRQYASNFSRFEVFVSDQPIDEMDRGVFCLILCTNGSMPMARDGDGRPEYHIYNCWELLCRLDSHLAEKRRQQKRTCK